MIDAVKALPPNILAELELKIWNVTTIEGFNRKKELKVGRIPSLTINEQLAFESLIPHRKKLLNKIQEFLQESDKG